MGTIATPPTFGANGMAPSTYLNTMRDILVALLNPPTCELIQTVAQSIPTGAQTPITFDIEVVDTDNMHSTTSNTSRVTISTPGRYLINGGITYVVNGTGYRSAFWRVNGSDYAGSEVTLPPNASVQTAVPVRPRMIYLSAGDYIELSALQSSGAGLNTSVAFASHYSTMSVRWIGNA